MTDERAAENSRSDEPADGSDDVVAAEVVEDGQSDGPQPEREWWDDPGMPWQRKPTRSDIACLTWIGVLGILSLAMLPLRAWLLGSPDRLPWLVGLIGSRSGTALLGSVTRVGGQLPVVWPILLGVVMSIKLDWTYWWAGKLWGRGMIEVWAGQSPRAGRNYARAVRCSGNELEEVHAARLCGMPGLARRVFLFGLFCRRPSSQSARVLRESRELCCDRPGDRHRGSGLHAKLSQG